VINPQSCYYYRPISNNRREIEAPVTCWMKPKWIAVGNCYRDWLISPSLRALKPVLSISLEQKPSHLGCNTYYPFRVVKTDILHMHSCLMIRFKCSVFQPWMVITFVLLLTAHPNTISIDTLNSLWLLVFWFYQSSTGSWPVVRDSGSQQQEAVLIMIKWFSFFWVTTQIQPCFQKVGMLY